MKNIARRMLVTAFCTAIALPLAYGQNESCTDYGGGPDSSHYIKSKQITKGQRGPIGSGLGLPARRNRI